MEREIQIGKVYRHFKGGMYKVQCVARDSETLEKVVVYVNIADQQKIWVQPLSEFLSEIDHEKYPEVEQKYRFQLAPKITLNDDRNHVEKIRTALKKNDGYCPCSIIKNDDTRCMCKEFREQNVSGLCHCGLYMKTIIAEE